MSSEAAIVVRGLAKRYRLSQEAAIGGHLRDAIAAAIGRRLRARTTPAGRDWVWALDHVSFEVPHGEVLGVIGRNGAGKTTLLKLLSGITDPTAGEARIRGQVGALLEVGTGFHPDLTGRENVYLNGAILGMRRREIERKFDQIVEFAGFERFIDTPVKRYSSGMYLRLAFSVAAHLEPDILVIDEVLAVGDAEFQKRCLGKMSEVARTGRTILFVSHNMHAIGSLCDRAIMLDAGRIVFDGASHDAVRRYLATVGAVETRRLWNRAERPGNEFARLASVEISALESADPGLFLSGDELVVTIEIDIDVSDRALQVGFDLMTVDGALLFRSFHTDPEEEGRPALLPGRNVLRCRLPTNLLNAGSYVISPKVGLHPVGWLVEEDAAVQFEVVVSHGARSFQRAAGPRPGLLLPVLEWQVEHPGEHIATAASADRLEPDG